MVNCIQSDLRVVRKQCGDELLVQKLELPFDSSKYPLKPGEPVLCETTSGSYFMCLHFSLSSNFASNYCYLDTSVRFYRNTPEIEIHRSIFAASIDNLTNLKEITSLPAGVKFSVLLLDVYLERVYPDDGILVGTLREVLQMFTFSSNCVIDLNSLGSYNFGIQSVHVLTCDGNVSDVGTANEDTNVVIRNVFYLGNSSVRFNPIGGVLAIEQELNEIIDQSKECDGKRSIHPCLHALIYGFNGVGKTSLVHNQIITKKCSLFEIRSADILRPYPGETEEVLRGIFKNASDFAFNFKGKCTPVILIEDVDVLCPKVRIDLKAHLSRISSQIMLLLDDLHKSRSTVVVIATTSKIEELDGRMRRPGRLEREIFMGVPGEKQRLEILEVSCREHFGADKITNNLLLKIAERTPGYVGADLATLTQHARKLLISNHPNQLFTEDVIFKSLTDSLKHVHASTHRGCEMVTRSNLSSLSTVAGLKSLKSTLEVAVLVPLRHPHSFIRFNLPRPKGILLYGPPGCAKTTIAKCLAYEANMSFIAASGAEIYSPYVGDAEKFISNLFYQARLSSPCVLFLDEIDSIVGSRSIGTSNNNVPMQVLSTLLIEMDGIGMKIQSAVSDAANESHVLVIAATNRPDLIDDALMRPGRFDKLIHVPAPDENSRLEILSLVTEKIPTAVDVDLAEIATKTKYFSGADLCNLCKEAALNALTADMEATEVTHDDFEAVLLLTRPSLNQKQIDFYNDFQQKHQAM